MSLVQSLQTAKDHLEASVRIQAEEGSRVQREREEERAVWRKERSDLQSQLNHFDTRKDDATKDRQVQKYQEKSQSYKKKLRLALSNVQTLAQRVAQYELQMVAEREDESAALPSQNPQKGSKPAPSKLRGHTNSSDLGGRVYAGDGSLDDFNQMIKNLEDDDIQHQIQQILEENRLALGHQQR